MKSWPKVRLGEVLAPVAREEKVDASKEYRLLGIRLEGQGPFLRETVMGTQTSATKLFRVATNDFIYSRLFACRGAFGVIAEELNGCYVSGEFPTFVPVPGKVDVEFLKYWFRLPSVIATVDADCSGSTPLTRNRFKENFFLALEIPLPPLAEQRRVVARIEELAAQIHEARTLRHQAAEEAEALPLSTRNRLFETELSDVRSESLESLVTVVRGSSPRPKGDIRYYGGPVPRLLIADITRDGKHVTPRIDSLTPEGANLSRPMPRGSLVLAISGSYGLPAFLAVDACIHDGFIGFRDVSKHVDPEYLYHVMLWRKPYFDSVVKNSGLQNLTTTHLKKMSVPVPPLAEQRRIVGELDALQAEEDALKRLQAETAAELAALLSALLDRAFKGEL